MTNQPIQLPYRRAKSRAEWRRRVLDIALAGATLGLLWPIMALIALAIMVESGLPILFAQTRFGQNGRPFRMFKFRKFRNDCGPDGLPLTLNGDARLTVVGRFLRAGKLDELPQLWNVLNGDMSVVGPRPESLAFADCFTGGFEAILEHKPGILGPCQAAFRNELAFFPEEEDPLEFYRAVLFPVKGLVDLKYYPNRTLRSDAIWIGIGVLAVFGFHPSWTNIFSFRKYSG